MITIEWTGRLCNRLTQYAGARVIADHAGIQLQHPSPELQSFGHVYSNFSEYFSIQPPPVHAQCYAGDAINLDDNWVLANYLHLSDMTPGRYHITGNMQVYKFLQHHYDRICSILVPCKSVCKKEGVLVHARLGDISVERSGTIEYYQKALQQLPYQHGWIVTDPMSQDHDVIKQLQQQYDLKLYIATPVEQLFFSIGFDAAILSTGSFSWWMGALSNAQTVFYYDMPQHLAWHPPLFCIKNWQPLC